MTTRRAPLRLFTELSIKLILPVAKITVAATLAWSVLRLYPGDRWLLVRLGSYFTPWLLLATSGSLLAALVARRRRLTGLALLALLLVGGRYNYLMVPPAQSAAPHLSATSLRVMSFNVHYANRNTETIAALIKNEAPDVIALQEFMLQNQQDLLSMLADQYPHHALQAQPPFSMGILSRYPVEALPTPAEVSRTQRVQISSPAGPVIVWNIHPIVAVKQQSWLRQRQVLAAVAEQAVVDAAQGPLVVMGDFNTTDQAENYQLVAQHFTDVNQAVGHSFGLSFPDPEINKTVPHMPLIFRLLMSVGPLVGIDHILASDHFVPVNFHVVENSAGSDHRPVVATLNLAQ